MTKENNIRVWSLVALAVVGLTVILFSTSRWGVGISPDSILYIRTAQSLFEGNGFSVYSQVSGGSVPMTTAPPFFPVILSAIMHLGISAFAGMRWLNALFFGVSVFIAGSMVKRYTRSTPLSILCGVIMIFAPTMILPYVYGLSEAPFMFFALLNFFFITKFIDEKRRSSLYLAAITCSLAFLTKYQGAAFVGASLLAILLLSEADLMHRVVDSAIFTAISALPISLWLIRNLSISGGMSERMVTSEGTVLRVKQGLSVLASWFIQGRSLPPASSFFVLAIVLFALIAGLKYLGGQKEEDGKIEDTEINDKKLVTISAVFFFGYLAFLIFSDLFVAGTFFTDRILAPVYPIFLMLIICMFHDLVKKSTTEALKALTKILIVPFLFLYVTAGADIYKTAYYVGHGYNMSAWQEISKAIVDAVKELPEGTTLFTNVPEALFIYAGINARIFPSRLNKATNSLREEYLKELGLMEDDLNGGSAVILYIKVSGRNYLPNEEELRKRMPLTKSKDNDVLAVYRI